MKYRDENIVKHIIQDTSRALDVSQASLKKINEEERRKIKRLWKIGISVIVLWLVATLVISLWYFY